jgi:cation transport ATPase
LTGTITAGNLAVTRMVPLAGPDGIVDPHRDLPAALGALAAADPAPNATLRAIAAAWPAPAGWTPTAAVPFSSARKWSAAEFGGAGTWVLGAPEVVLAGSAEGTGILRQAEALAAAGNRVVLLGTAAARVTGDGPLPATAPVALTVLAEQVRDDAAETIAYFTEQGVRAMVVSGDHPRTVGTVAAEVGIADAEAPVDARTLPEDRPISARCSTGGRYSAGSSRTRNGPGSTRSSGVATWSG